MIQKLFTNGYEYDILNMLGAEIPLGKTQVFYLRNFIIIIFKTVFSAIHIKKCDRAIEFQILL